MADDLPPSRFDDLAQFLVSSRLLAVGVDDVVDRRLPAEFASNSSVAVLGMLAESGPMRPRDMLLDLPITSGGLTKLLDRLVELGMVERQREGDSDDRRSVVFRLTAAGRRTNRTLVRSIEDAVREHAPTVKQMADLTARLRPGPPSVHDGPSSTAQVLRSVAAMGLALERAVSTTGREPQLDTAAVIVLALLRLEGPVRPRRVVEVIGLSTGGTTKLLDRLQLSDLVVRRSGEVADDRRAVVVEPTDHGRLELERALARVDGIMAELDAAIQPLLRLTFTD